MATLRSIITRFGAQTDAASFARADAAADFLKSKLSSIAGILGVGLSVAGVISMAKHMAEAGSVIHDTSQALGIAAKDFQELSYVAKLAGGSGEELAKGLKRIAVAAFDATQGNEELKKTFKSLGVNLLDNNGKLKSAKDLMLEVGDGLKDLKNPTERIAIAQKLFGKEGARLIPILAQGSKEMNKQISEAHALGGIMSDELVEASDRLGDNFDKLGFAGQGLRNIIGEKLVPAFNVIIEKTLAWWTANKDLIQANLERFMEKFAFGLGFLAGIIDGFLLKMQEFLGTNDRLSTVLTILKDVVIALGIAWGIANLPILGTVAAIGFLILALEGLIDLGEKLGDWLADITEDFTEFWKIITDIVSAVKNFSSFGGLFNEIGGILGFGPGKEAPVISPQKQFVGGNNASQTNNVRVGDINVQSQPGMNERDLAIKTGQSVENTFQSLLMDANQSFITVEP